MDAELKFHIAAYAEDLVRSGVTREEAMRRARLEFGGIEQTKEECREATGVTFVESLVQDIRYGLRVLRKSPGFTFVAVLTLGLGIGANTAVFSVVNGVLLRPLSYPQSQQLYRVREIVPQIAKSDPLDANLPDFRIWQKQVHSFASVAIFEPFRANLTGLGEPEIVRGIRASANLLAVLGVQPALGRSFRAEEDEAGLGNVVILTNAFWRTRLEGDPTAMGKSLTLDGIPHEIIGVLPATFRFPSHYGAARIGYFVPLNGPKEYEQGLIGEFDFTALARLKPSTTPEKALAELKAVQAQIAKEANEGFDMSAVLQPLEEQIVGAARRGLVVLLAAVGAVLLIVCANLASLLLARVPGRMREAAIRRALGATHGRVIRQMLTETLLLSTAGGVVGVLAASLAMKWLMHWAPPDIPRLDEVGVDGRALLFALGAGVSTGCLFGFLPAWRASSSEPVENLKAGAVATTESRRTRRVREGLVAFEVGLTTLLLIVAGLFIASLERLLRVQTGFVAERVLVAEVGLSPQNYSQRATRLEFYDRVLAGLRALPGVRAAGWVSIAPLGGQGSVTGINIPGAMQKGGETPMANYRSVSPDYFSAMGIPLMQGRIFGPSDRGRKIVVVSQNVAERFWPGKNPIGQTCITEWGPDVPSEVVGVVGDIRTVSLDEAPLMMVYVPEWFNEISVPSSGAIVVRTGTDTSSPATAVREVIHGVDASVPIASLRPMREIVSEAAEGRRFPMYLVLSFAASSLLLASMGIFGVVGYSVEQRRQELGIRMAIGADVRDLLRMVLAEGTLPVMAGVAGGTFAAILAGRIIFSLLFGVSPYDPLTFVVVMVVVGSVGLMACYIPARRAMHVDPIVALRHE